MVAIAFRLRKVLEKTPTDRYTAVADFAADVTAHLVELFGEEVRKEALRRRDGQALQHRLVEHLWVARLIPDLSFGPAAAESDKK